MDGEATAAARRFRRGRVADDADNADDEGAADAFEKRERRPARRGAARRAATAARAARLAGGALSLPVLVGESPDFIPEPSVAVRNEAAAAFSWEMPRATRQDVAAMIAMRRLAARGWGQAAVLVSAVLLRLVPRGMLKNASPLGQQ